MRLAHSNKLYSLPLSKEPADLNWNMDTGASSHLNSSTINLSTIFNSCMYPSVLVSDGKSIPVTNTFPSPIREIAFYVDLLLAIVFFLAIIFFLGRPRDSLPSLVLVLKRNIRVLPMQLLRLAGCVIFYRTKHIEIDIHFVRDLVSTGRMRVLHVPSHYQYADIFPKGLPTALFDEFRSSLSVHSSPAQTTGGC
uniref:Ribonuclease H-like domain-containing protein n=1 Tax=Tanacetum cinerariifolium TaxID=118510 RepID=A0A6L2LX66_TANCI|nr:ribonuclease H-like domain-containing protein [Tanacetum cinerariifolium]